MSVQTKSRTELVRYAQTLKDRALKAREKTAKMAEQATDVALTTGSAFGMGFINSKYGGPDGLKLGPVPVPLIVAGAAYAAGLSGMAGNASRAMVAVGHGALAAWAASEGAKAGAGTT